MTEIPDQIVMNPGDWNKRWNEQQIGWHKTFVNPSLEKFLPAVVEVGKVKGQNVFLPLCGKSLDLIWLAKLGYTVFGLEFSELAVEAFFTENELKFEKSVNPNFSVFKGSDLPIVIYCMDLFKLDPSKLPKMDLIWDRGSFVAINVEERVKYLQLMSSILSTEGQILMATLNYDPPNWPGPPHFVRKDDFERLITESKFSAELLEEKDETQQKHKEIWNVNSVTQSVYLIKLKLLSIQNMH